VITEVRETQGKHAALKTGDFEAIQLFSDERKKGIVAVEIY
jgi:hypothetical protein